MMVDIDIMLRKTHLYEDKKTGERFDLPYRVYYPTGYDTSDAKTYPILFFLHGHGECGTDNRLQIRVLEKENRLLNMVMERDDCIIVAPQCPCNPKYEWVPLNHAWSTGSRELTEEPTIGLAAATSLLKTFLASGKVDLTRVYGAGISMGGYGTWELITRNSELFAAAIPVCGSGIPSLASRLVDIAIWAFHGEKDNTVPAQGSRDMVEAITAAGGKKIKYTEFPGVWHDSWIPAYKTEGLVDWLFEQHKAPFLEDNMINTLHAHETLINTWNFHGTTVDLMEWKPSVWCGKIGYATNNTDEPDVEKIARDAMNIFPNHEPNMREENWEVCISINYLSGNRPNGVMFGFRVDTEIQPNSYDVIQVPSALYMRVKICEETFDALGVAPWQGGIPPFAWIGERIAPALGYRYGDDTLPIFEYYGMNPKTQAPEICYLYVPVTK